MEALVSSDNEENKEGDISTAAHPKSNKWKEARRIGQELATRKSTTHKKQLSQHDSTPDKYHYLIKKIGMSKCSIFQKMNLLQTI